MVAKWSWCLNIDTLTGDLPGVGDVVTCNGVTYTVYESDSLTDHIELRRLFAKDSAYERFYPSTHRVFVWKNANTIPGATTWTCDNGASGTLLGTAGYEYDVLYTVDSGDADRYATIAAAVVDLLAAMPDPNDRFHKVELGGVAVYDEQVDLDVGVVRLVCVGVRRQGGSTALIAYTTTAPSINMRTTGARGWVWVEGVALRPTINGAAVITLKAGSAILPQLVYGVTVASTNVTAHGSNVIVWLSGDSAVVDTEITDPQAVNQWGYSISVAINTGFLYIQDVRFPLTLACTMRGPYMGSGDIDRMQMFSHYGIIQAAGITPVVVVRRSILKSNLMTVKALTNFTAGSVLESCLVWSRDGVVLFGTSVVSTCRNNIFMNVDLDDLTGDISHGANWIDDTCSLVSWTPDANSVNGVETDIDPLTGLPDRFSPVWGGNDAQPEGVNTGETFDINHKEVPYLPSPGYRGGVATRSWGPFEEPLYGVDDGVV